MKLWIKFLLFLIPAVAGTIFVFWRFSPEQAIIKRAEDRKSTRLNSSHVVISYAVFCLKKKRKEEKDRKSSLKHNARTSART